PFTRSIRPLRNSCSCGAAKDTLHAEGSLEVVAQSLFLSHRREFRLPGLYDCGWGAMRLHTAAVYLCHGTLLRNKQNTCAKGSFHHFVNLLCETRLRSPAPSRMHLTSQLGFSLCTALNVEPSHILK